jgi:hypothetical protein
MKNFLAVYFGGPASAQKAGWDALSETERQERQKKGIAAWHQWAESNKKFIVEGGAPLGKTKCASRGGIADTKNELTAYTVVRAESHEAAAKLFESHPHFAIFPGERIEIMECLPIPTM